MLQYSLWLLVSHKVLRFSIIVQIPAGEPWLWRVEPGSSQPFAAPGLGGYAAFWAKAGSDTCLWWEWGRRTQNRAGLEKLLEGALCSMEAISCSVGGSKFLKYSLPSIKWTPFKWTVQGVLANVYSHEPTSTVKLEPVLRKSLFLCSPLPYPAPSNYWQFSGLMVLLFLDSLSGIISCVALWWTSHGPGYSLCPLSTQVSTQPGYTLSVTLMLCDTCVWSGGDEQCLCHVLPMCSALLTPSHSHPAVSV